MVISKLVAAKIQLDSAIDHFFKGDHISAVTLAGAAEDVLAGLLKLAGEQNPFEFLHDWYQKTYNTTVSEKVFSRQIANPVRNWLKQAKEDSDTELEISKIDSIMMLMRALPCYFKLTKSYTAPMDRFYRYATDNIDQINKLFSSEK